MISKPDPQLGGWSVHYLAGKGDQKYKVEWLLEKRNYLHLSSGGGEICRRCFAGRRDRPWLDFFGLPFNQPEEVEAATMSSLSAQSCKSACVQKARTAVFSSSAFVGVGEGIPHLDLDGIFQDIFVACAKPISRVVSCTLCGRTRMWQLSGWTPHMEHADVLHSVWLGTARDSAASLALVSAPCRVSTALF